MNTCVDCGNRSVPAPTGTAAMVPNPAVDPYPPQPAVLDGRYRLGEVVGIGAMAEVYRAHDLRLRRDVAVKVFHHHLLEDPATPSRVRAEAAVLARLNSPHVVRLYDASGTRAGRAPYLVMELVDGSTLDEQIREHPRTLTWAARVGRSLGAALAHVHEAAVVHGDVKPVNVLLTRDGRPKLADFGVAVAAGSATGTPRTVTGTAGYLAPEQVRGVAASAASDVYALGLVLLESLTGHQEYPGADARAAVARLHRAPVIPAALPGPWRELLTELTHADPARRPTAAQTVQRLASITEAVGVVAAAPSRARRSRWSLQAVTSAAAALLVVLSVGGGMLVERTGPLPTRPAAGVGR